MDVNWLTLNNFKTAHELERRLNVLTAEQISLMDLKKIPKGKRVVVELTESVRRLYALVRILTQSVKQAEKEPERVIEGNLLAFAEAFFNCEFDSALGEKRALHPFMIHRHGIVSCYSAEGPKVKRA